MSAATDASKGGAVAAAAADKPERHEQRHRFTDFMVDHHFLAMGLGVGAILLMVVLWQAAVPIKDVSENGGGNFFAHNEVESRRYYAFEKSQGNEDETPVPQLSQTADDFTMTLYYSSRDGREGNVFSKEGLLAIFDTEHQVYGRTSGIPADEQRSFTVKNFDDNCHTPYSVVDGEQQPGRCNKPFSVLDVVFFDGVDVITRDMVEGLNDTYIAQKLAEASTDEKLAAGNNFFFARDFSRDNTSSRPYQSWVTRSQVKFGVPLKSKDGETTTINGTAHVSVEFPYYVDDNDVDQKSRHEDFVVQYTDLFDTPDPEAVKVNYVEQVLSNKEINDLVNGDLVLAAFAGFCIFLWLIFGTGSLWLGATGLVTILASLPYAMVVYHGVLGFEVTTQFNQLALYVILGIGADDIFVFTEAWNQLRAEGETGTDSWSMHSRMLHTWVRAASAMAVTTSTTFVAFMMTATSPLPGIAVFGVVAGLLVLFVYVLTVTFYPACVVVWELYMRDLRWFGWFREGGRFRGGGAPVADAGAAEMADRRPVSQQKERDMSCSGARGAETSVTRSSRVNADVDVSAYGAMDRFFYLRLAPFLFKRRFVLLAVMSCVYLAGIVGFANLETPEDLDFPLPDDSEFQITQDLANSEFPPSQEAQGTHQVGMFWGLEPDSPIDRSGLDWNDLDDWGEYNYDDAFEFDQATQEYVESVCDRLATREDAKGQAFTTRVVCLPKLFREWKLATNFSDPDAGLRSFDADWNGTLAGLDYSKDMVSLRLQDFFLHRDGDGVEVNLDYRQNVGNLGTASSPEPVRWVRLLIDTTMSLKYKRTEQNHWFDEWAAEMELINALPSAPAGARRGMQGAVMWAGKVSNDLLVSSTYVSVFVSFAVAVVIMLGATRNLPVAGFASLCLLGVVMTAMGLFVAMGRKLGIVEAVVAQVLVGLAVDFTVHLAHAYNSCEISGRFNRGRSALFEILGSITLGAVTTATAAIVLQFAILEFFVLFGRFILVTIATSWMFAVFFFMPLMMVIGPVVKPDGDLAYLWRTRCGRRPDPEVAERQAGPDAAKKASIGGARETSSARNIEV